jgi:hypothetical protein
MGFNSVGQGLSVHMAVVTQLYFQIVEEINYMFRPFSGLSIIRLRLEYWRKLIHYNLDIKNGETRSCLTMFGEMRLTLMMAHPEKGRNM